MIDKFYYWYYKHKARYYKIREKRKYRRHFIQFLASKVLDNSSRRVVYDEVLEDKLSFEEAKLICNKLKIPFYVEKINYRSRILLKD